MAREEDREEPPLVSQRDDVAELIAAMENVPEPVLTVADGTIEFATGPSDRVLGHPCADLVGEPVTRVLPKAFADRLATFLDGSQADGPDAFDWHGRALTADDRRVDVAVSVRWHRTDSDRVTAIVRNEAGAADEATAGETTVPDRHYRELVDGLATHGVAILDRGRRVLTWNAGAEGLTGRTASDVVGGPLSVLLPDDQGEKATVDLEGAFDRAATEGSFTSHGWWARDDGSLFWGALTIRALRDSDGIVEGFGAVVHDRTEQKRTAEERQLLVEVSRAVTEAETFADGVHVALEAVCKRTQWSYAEAWAPPEGMEAEADADVDRLERVASHVADQSLAEFQVASDAVTFRPEEGLPGRVWATGEPEWLPDTAGVPVEVFNRARLAENVGLGAALGVPITVADRPVAVLTFFLRERREIDEQLAEVVTTVATELGKLVAHKQDEDRLERERALLERVFETSPVGLVLLSDDGSVRRANGRTGEMLGQPPEKLTSRRFRDLPVELSDAAGNPIDYDEFPPGRAMASGSRVDDVEYRIVRADGTTGWLSVSAAPIREDGSIDEVVVVLEDITELKERERSLRAFRKAIEQAGHSIYITDTDATIEYVNPAFEEITGYAAEEVLGEDPSILSSGYHDDAFYEDLWETILDGEIWTGEVVNRRKSGERYVVNQTIAPITDRTGKIERFVAVNTDITERKRQQRELERQRDRLARLHQLMATMWDVTQALVAASTEPELEAAVCEALVGTDFCEVAWIGTYDQRTETITPAACAGIDEAALEPVSLAGDDAADATVPCREAVRGREVAVTLAEEELEMVTPWRTDDLERGYRASAAVPLVHGNLLYGTLNLYSNRPRAFDEEEREQLTDLGEAVAHGLDTVKTRKLLHADQVVELEVRSRDERAFVVDASTEVNGTLSVTGTVPRSDEEVLLYTHIGDGSVDQLRAVAEDRDDVEGVQVIDDEGEEVRVAIVVQSTASLAKQLMDCGAQVVEATVSDGEATIVAQITPDHDVRSVVEEVRATFPDLDLRAKRETERTPELDRALLTTLTDRQRAVLAAAYHAGYFAWPRESTAEEVAATMDVSGATFHKHLRRAEQYLLDALLDVSPRDSSAE